MAESGKFMTKCDIRRWFQGILGSSLSRILWGDADGDLGDGVLPASIMVNVVSGLSDENIRLSRRSACCFQVDVARERFDGGLVKSTNGLSQHISGACLMNAAPSSMLALT
jgi:hypothetical protein